MEPRACVARPFVCAHQSLGTLVVSGGTSRRPVSTNPVLALLSVASFHRLALAFWSSLG